MLLKVLFSSLVLFSFSAQAAESEFFYQADAGQSAFTPKFEYLTGSVRGKSATSDTTMNGFGFGANMNTESLRCFPYKEH